MGLHRHLPGSRRAGEGRHGCQGHAQTTHKLDDGRRQDAWLRNPGDVDAKMEEREHDECAGDNDHLNPEDHAGKAGGHGAAARATQGTTFITVLLSTRSTTATVNRASSRISRVSPTRPSISNAVIVISPLDQASVPAPSGDPIVIASQFS